MASLKKVLNWMFQFMSMFMSRMIPFMSRMIQFHEEEEEAVVDDIWMEIGKRLESRLDVLRFRSVCSTWRRTLPPLLRFPLKVPRPPGAAAPHRWSYSHYISEINFYSSNNNQIFCFESEVGHFSASAMVHKSHFLFHQIQIPPISSLNYLSTAYHIHSIHPPKPNPIRTNSINLDVLKIAIICCDYVAVNPNYPPLNHLKVVAHLTDWKLAVLNLSGGATSDDWQTGFCDITFEDIVNYRGRLYGVDNLGRAFFMDYHSLQMTQVAPALPPNPEIAKLPPFHRIVKVPPYKRKLMHLVVVSEELYIFIHEPHNLLTPRLYKLKLGKWVEADHDLPDRVFIQNLQCNFVAPRDLFVPCRTDSVITHELMTHDLPRFCSWPDYPFVKVNATGIYSKHIYDVGRLFYRFCDIPAVLDYYEGPYDFLG